MQESIYALGKTDYIYQRTNVSAARQSHLFPSPDITEFALRKAGKRPQATHVASAMVLYSRHYRICVKKIACLSVKIFQQSI
jgi:hypothetical protein